MVNYICRGKSCWRNFKLSVTRLHCSNVRALSHSSSGGCSPIGKPSREIFPQFMNTVVSCTCGSGEWYRVQTAKNDIDRYDTIQYEMLL